MVAIFGGLIALVGFIPYNEAAIRGRTKPNVITWMVMALVGSMVTFVIFMNGGPWILPAAFTVGRAATCCVAVWAVFKYKKFEWPTGIQALSLAGFGLIVIFYALFMGFGQERGELGDPNFLNIFMIMTIMIEFFGVLPTLKSSYKNPKDENLFGWMCFFAGSVISLSQADYTFWGTLYPSWAALISACPIVLIVLGKRRKTTD